MRAFALAAVFLTACGARSEMPVCEGGDSRPCESLCGAGVELCVEGRWLPCNARSLRDAVAIDTTVRDFHASHPDFESDVLGDDPGIVEDDLGLDGAPVYASAASTPTTTGKANFDQWFHDVPEVNASETFVLTLARVSESLPVYRFDSPEFFPVDDRLFQNEGSVHNFHFTLAMTVDFRYAGGETFTFRGDDDVFVFIGRRLAIDLGGVHSAEVRTVNLDAIAAEFGLFAGDVYPLALFFAERHTTGSSFFIETTIADFAACP